MPASLTDTSRPVPEVDNARDQLERCVVFNHLGGQCNVVPYTHWDAKIARRLVGLVEPGSRSRFSAKTARYHTARFILGPALGEE